MSWHDLCDIPDRLHSNDPSFESACEACYVYSERTMVERDRVGVTGLSHSAYLRRAYRLDDGTWSRPSSTRRCISLYEVVTYGSKLQGSRGLHESEVDRRVLTKEPHRWHGA